MIAWLQPAALVLLAAAAAPVLIHLLHRQRARRVVVPSLRFVPGRSESAVRLRSLSDPWLLLLRMSIVACAALAVARPLLLTDARQRAWQERSAVAIVAVPDTSADEAIRAQREGAHVSTVILAPRISEGLQHAAAWLAAAPPAKREIVVVGNLRHDAISAADVVHVPNGVGIRFVHAGADTPASSVTRTVLTGDGSRVQVTTVDGESTAVTLTSADEDVRGLRLLVAAADAPHAAALLRVVSRAGVFAPTEERPLAVRFAGGEPLPPSAVPPAPWTFGAAARVLAWSRESGIAVHVRPAGEGLAVEADVAPGSPEAAEVLAAALEATADPGALRQLETERIPDATLRAWTRDPQPPPAGAWRNAGESDGRWLWGVALTLLTAEGLLRRRRTAQPVSEPAHAA